MERGLLESRKDAVEILIKKVLKALVTIVWSCSEDRKFKERKRKYIIEKVENMVA